LFTFFHHLAHLKINLYFEMLQVIKAVIWRILSILYMKNAPRDYYNHLVHFSTVLLKNAPCCPFYFKMR